MSLLDRFRRTGKAPTFIEKVRASECRTSLDLLVEGATRNGRIFTDDENAAIAWRKCELEGRK